MGVTSVVVRRLCLGSERNTETQFYGYLCISYSVYADLCFDRHVSIVSWLAEQRPRGEDSTLGWWKRGAWMAPPTSCRSPSPLPRSNELGHLCRLGPRSRLTTSTYSGLLSDPQGSTWDAVHAWGPKCMINGDLPQTRTPPLVALLCLLHSVSTHFSIHPSVITLFCASRAVSRASYKIERRPHPWRELEVRSNRVMEWITGADKPELLLVGSTAVKPYRSLCTQPPALTCFCAESDNRSPGAQQSATHTPPLLNLTYACSALP